MNYLFLSISWLIYEIKNFLFWIYLWQLKEYHIGRFIDYFRTEKGKSVLLRKFQILKIFLFLISLFFFRAFLFSVFFFVYFLELTKSIYDLLRRRLIKPVFTSKTIFLNFVCFFFTLFYLFVFFEKSLNFLFFLFVFDLFSPIIFSGIVLSFQPLAAILRFQIIEKAIKKREKLKELLVIGITGSYGKTSTKEFLAEILEKKFPGEVLKTKENQNSEVGISKCILEELNENHKIFIVEMGAYNKGGIKLLAKIVKPKIGILTGINEQHLALFGSMENLISAEGGKELIESLPEDGLVIFNGENEILREIYERVKIKKKIVGISKKEFDLWAGNIKVKREVLFFQAFSEDGDFADFNLNLIGEQNIQNILLAACCAKEIGMSLKEISMAAKRIKQEQSGVKLIKYKKINIVQSTYSANPASVIAHLEYLKTWSGKKAIIMPCLIELGREAKRIHQEIGKKIGKVCDLAIILTKDYFKEIKSEAIKSGMKEEEILLLKDANEILKNLKRILGPENLILIEGRIPPELLNNLIKSIK